MFANRLFEHMDRLFGPLGFDGPSLSPPAPAYPPLSVWEDADALYVEAEAPGLTAEDIGVSVADGDRLTISAERPAPPNEDGAWLYQECGYGAFSRTITLPVAVNPDAVEAKYETGVLTVTLRKAEAAKPRRIAVKAERPALAGAV
ncbi:Heat shock protein, HSP20 OS=Rhodopirellula maiorica SM1 GN=RMSM_05792 PE=3 SV=1: HSP20 [Gemmata massiliana]|uniref:SHSP domain-containing protein n=1 Tax=Gemmata massiliana TaxID=1210884 RepID=A0A6P2CTC6_9BACT|nr:Hsp20/alpha crystallin family protein [Gemmata massiliana]VTR91629.1 Heat shock protein, HSP20 OS=Rhodopirellula maiorica SM1 GN=RMSM_05792 PE=3 SV=1: HSP20 [Gemmata massiliana]VTR91636.1 Heat shock protein, HSP20 OS=Rhodopirellula maiorica SM1 GN=RMSM_05792 PE=3 SV=1: HSP20 [Gemmata massiliana]